jgi:hypothetical protein
VLQDSQGLSGSLHDSPLQDELVNVSRAQLPEEL